MAEERNKEYWERKNLERRELQLDAEQPTFLDWLLTRHDTTPTVMRVLCKQTARYGSGKTEYEKAMEWYRRRYRYEKELREQMIKSNPF